jgi:hypothetical protein
MAYVPPHLRKKVTAVAAPPNPTKVEFGAITPSALRAEVGAPPPRGIRFIGNATGELNIAPNTGLRYSPRSRNATPRKPTRKLTVRRISPNAKPLAKPTTAVSEMPPKFRTMLLHSGVVGPKKATRKKHKKRHGTRKHK